LLTGWLSSRLNLTAELNETRGPGITAAAILTTDSEGAEYPISIERPAGAAATLSRGTESPRTLPLSRRQLGDLLAEELRRMDTDPVYAEALSNVTGVAIDEHGGNRVLVWRDPALTST
jgi:glucose-6-phosphate dehydrogenase assembly protein OpcA